MDVIETSVVSQKAKAFLNQPVYIHFEVNPAGYWRNGRAVLQALHLKGNGPYRVFLTLDNDNGLIQMNGMTHMELTDSMMIFTGFDDKGRIAETLEISRQPF